jgi:formylmethanofuran dehydrogenase subunit E
MLLTANTGLPVPLLLKREETPMLGKCHICGERIWEDRWPGGSDRVMKNNVCFFCFNMIKEGRGYRPKAYKKSSFAVCDRCGEISENVNLTSEGWMCEDCAE